MASGNAVLDGWDPPEGLAFTGVKVFSATKAREREELGSVITAWIRNNPDVEIVDRVVLQSSDNEFHCLSITLFFRDRA